MESITGFMPNGERYLFDFEVCKSEDGWAQVDTTQDASYYGNWFNPITREFRTYAEGDTAHHTFDNDEEMITWLREFVKWNRDSGYWRGIDTMMRPDIELKFDELGINDLTVYERAV